MKPRIKKISGVWYCGILYRGEGPIFESRLGLGFDPMAAWQDWKAQQ